MTINFAPKPRPPMLEDSARVGLHPDASQHEILAVLARTLPVYRYLEIGVQEGCSLWVVHEAAKRTLRHVALCDDWGREAGGSGRGDHDHITKMMRGLGYRGELFYLDGQSQDRVPSLRERLGEYRADLIHVDGDHRYPAALADLRNCWPICTGAMVVHDVDLIPDVRRAVEEFLRETPDPPSVSYHSGGNGVAVFQRPTGGGA